MIWLAAAPRAWAVACTFSAGVASGSMVPAGLSGPTAILSCRHRGGVQKRSLRPHRDHREGVGHGLRAERVVPLSGSRAISTSSPSPVPTLSPIWSIGASSCSPSPMTTRPRMSRRLSSVRMASTAAGSARSRCRVRPDRRRRPRGHGPGPGTASSRDRRCPCRCRTWGGSGSGSGLRRGRPGADRSGSEYTRGGEPVGREGRSDDGRVGWMRRVRGNQAAQGPERKKDGGGRSRSIGVNAKRKAVAS